MKESNTKGENKSNARFKRLNSIFEFILEIFKGS